MASWDCAAPTSTPRTNRAALNLMIFDTPAYAVVVMSEPPNFPPVHAKRQRSRRPPSRRRCGCRRRAADGRLQHGLGDGGMPPKDRSPDPQRARAQSLAGWRKRHQLTLPWSDHQYLLSARPAGCAKLVMPGAAVRLTLRQFSEPRRGRGSPAASILRRIKRRGRRRNGIVARQPAERLGGTPLIDQWRHSNGTTAHFSPVAGFPAAPLALAERSTSDRFANQGVGRGRATPAPMMQTRFEP